MGYGLQVTGLGLQVKGYRLRVLALRRCSGEQSSESAAARLCRLLPAGRKNPVCRDSSKVKRERAVGDGYGIEGMSSDSGILLGIILNFCHFLSDLKGLTK